MTSRPCSVATSIRSTSMRDTIAVELIASVLPSASPVCHDNPSNGNATVASATVIATCAKPSPNTARRMAESCGRLNSSPTENMRNTIPNSPR